MRGNGPYVVLADQKLRRGYGTLLSRWARPHIPVYLAASEQTKSLERIGKPIRALLGQGLRRNSRLLVVGGGVLQDVGCFVASLVFRGIPWFYIPTTLLAQADSCIGGKSSINVQQGKNLLGTFFPPQKVFLWGGFLKSLPWDQFRSGVGEILKLHWIDRPSSLPEVTRALLRCWEGDLRLAHRFVAGSLKIKKRFIEADEMDRGRRRILNFGHTFGHAYEKASEYAIPHGIAVTLGMLSAAFFSASRGFGPADIFDRIRPLLHPWYEPYQGRLSRLSAEKVVRFMTKDKKNTNGRIQLILPMKNGWPRLAPPVCPKNVLQVLQDLFKQMAVT